MVIIVLGFVIIILIIFAIIQFYKKSDLGKSLMLMYIMQKHGPNSIVAIDLLQISSEKCWLRMELRCPRSAWFTRWETVITAFLLLTVKRTK